MLLLALLSYLGLLKEALAIVEVGVCTLWRVLPVRLVADLQDLAKQLNSSLQVAVAQLEGLSVSVCS